MKALILGGTGFLGTATTTALLGAGAVVTVLHRGLRAPPPPGANQIRTDRRCPSASALRALAQPWDVVIDVNARSPDDLLPLLQPLSGNAGRFLFVSSASVYRRPKPPGTPIREDSPTLDRIATPRVEEEAGRAKLICESLARRIAASVILLRPGLISGPGDPTGRFSYWLQRSIAGHTVLVPMAADQCITCIDVRDVAKFILHRSIVPSSHGEIVFNLRGHKLSAETFISLLSRLTPDGARPRWIDGQHLRNAGITPWRDIPLWLPEDSPEYGLMFLDDTAARNHGLTIRPVEETLNALNLLLPPHLDKSSIAP